MRSERGVIVYIPKKRKRYFVVLFLLSFLGDMFCHPTGTKAHSAGAAIAACSTFVISSA